jgi:tRNA/tmRNA/rRNA uracil-C5-methylase (TrmA/RlmC/RlmD family)
MIEKNDIICAVTDAIGSNGEGIIRHEGITFFVPACLPGEKVCFKVLKVKSGQNVSTMSNQKNYDNRIRAMDSTT